MTAGGFGDGGNLRYQILWGADLTQALSEKFYYRVHVGVVESTRDQVRVAVSHVLTGIGYRTAEHHRQEALLFCDLAIHVDIVEELAHAVIAQDFTVEDIDRCINGRFSSQLFVEGQGRGSLHI